MIKSKAKITDEFKKIDEAFAKTGKDKYLDYSLIKPFHESFPLAQNGIAAFIAPMGSGKSYTYTKLMAKQEVVKNEPLFEDIVICSTSAAFDATVKTFKPLIKRSRINVIEDEKLVAFLDVYMKRLRKYNAMYRYLDSKFKDVDEEMKHIITKHGLRTSKKTIEHIGKKLAKYQWSSFPHRMLLILDDFASHPLLKSKDAPLSRMLKKLRHYHINVIICVQTVKSIPKDLKRVLADCYLFPGISEIDFKDLIKEGPFGFFNSEQLYTAYKSLKNDHDVFAIHIKAKRIIITPAVKNP